LTSIQQSHITQNLLSDLAPRLRACRSLAESLASEIGTLLSDCSPSATMDKIGRIDGQTPSGIPKLTESFNDSVNLVLQLGENLKASTQPVAPGVPSKDVSLHPYSWDVFHEQHPSLSVVDHQQYLRDWNRWMEKRPSPPSPKATTEKTEPSSPESKKMPLPRLPGPGGDRGGSRRLQSLDEAGAAARTGTVDHHVGEDVLLGIGVERDRWPGCDGSLAGLVQEVRARLGRHVERSK